jgi:hypothetical protein
MPIDVSNFDPNEKGYELPPEGFYHVQLENVMKTEKPEKGSSIEFIWLIVGSPNEAKQKKAIGRKIKEFFSDWTPQYGKQLLTIGLACNVYTVEQLTGARDRGEQIPDPDLDSWVGLSCVVNVTHKKRFNDKTKTDATIGWNYYNASSAEAKESKVLLNKDILHESGRITPTADEMF